jgi:hypothetical protein
MIEYVPEPSADTPADAPTADEGAHPQQGAPSSAPPSPSQSAIREIGELGRDIHFHADWRGDNGRAAQKAAVERKAELHERAYGDGDEVAAPQLPDAIQDAMKDQSSISQAAAAAMTPGQSADDYSFTWDNSHGIELDVLKAMNDTAAEAAFEVGASPEYARSTVNALQDMITRSTGPATEATLQDALSRHFGDNVDATVEAAKATLAKMPERSKKWALDATDHLDGNGVAWFIGRLASVAKVNSPR